MAVVHADNTNDFIVSGNCILVVASRSSKDTCWNIVVVVVRQGIFAESSWDEPPCPIGLLTFENEDLSDQKEDYGNS